MIPMNFLSSDQTADYINTGAWSQKAIAEAKLFGKVNIAGSSEEAKFTFIPSQNELKFNPDAVYVHMTSNNTIFGTQWQYWPDVHGKPLICDMSSDIMSRKVDVSKFAMIYAGAQKNIGPAGVTVVIMDPDFAAKQKSGSVEDSQLLDAYQGKLAIQHAADLHHLHDQVDPAVDGSDRRAGGNRKTQQTEERYCCIAPSTIPVVTTRARFVPTAVRE